FNSFTPMATQVDLSVHVPTARPRTKRPDGPQRKEDLEREVAMLHKMLDHEEKVNKILEHTIRRPDGSAIHIPSFLPPKALYYISKAIKGDYTMNALTSNEKKGNPGDPTKRKETYGLEEVIFQEKASKKSGTRKPPSPTLPPRNSASKAIEHGLEFSLDFPSKSVSNDNSLEEKSNKLQPNKLSESIMKCLIFIFVRLLRTSRAIEIEKSGTISRSTHATLSSRSFRAETGLNPKTSLALQKESKQQDPYGIFDIEDSIPRDIGPYKNLVRFTSSSLDPKRVSSSSSSPLLQKLRVLINNLQNVELRFLTHQQKLAFWINMYNACIMHGFLQYGVPSNQESLLALMKKATLKIGGSKISAMAIENFILRAQSSSNLKDVYWKDEEYEKESAIRTLYRLESLEPNITFALCCGTRSSPAVRIYTANGVTTELEKSKLDYLQSSIVVTNKKKLVIPELLVRNMVDFSRNLDLLVEWICQQLPTSWSLKKSIVECYKGLGSGKISDIVEKIPYEFEFQYLLSV
ncbi:hypothetical protein IFM89_023315, partial [Coptis chinensis]